MSADIQSMTQTEAGVQMDLPGNDGIDGSPELIKTLPKDIPKVKVEKYDGEHVHHGGSTPYSMPEEEIKGSRPRDDSKLSDISRSRQDSNLGDGPRSRNESNLSNMTIDSLSHSGRQSPKIIESINEDEIVHAADEHGDGGNISVSASPPKASAPNIPQLGEPFPPQQQPAPDTPPTPTLPHDNPQPFPEQQPDLSDVEVDGLSDAEVGDLSDAEGITNDFDNNDFNNKPIRRQSPKVPAEGPDEHHDDPLPQQQPAPNVPQPLPQQQPAQNVPQPLPQQQPAPIIPQPLPQQQPADTPKDHITVVLTGKSGAGKSTLVNKVFGVKTDTKMGANPGTKKIKTYSVSSHGVTIDIIDTVGFSPTNMKNRLDEISKHTQGKADLVIYCLPISPGFKFHDSNPDIMKSLTEAFGRDIWKHCVVVLTFSNQAWDRISMDYEDDQDQDAAIAEYQAYIAEYVENFKRELKKLKVRNVKITTPFDPQRGNNAVAVIPAGFKQANKVLAGVEYPVTKRAVDFTDLASATQDPSVPYMDSQVATIVDTRPAVTTSNWATILVDLILTRSNHKADVLLQFRYGRERFARSLKDQGVKLAVGGGAAGGVLGGAAGAGAGAVLGAAGGPIGVPIGATIGIVTGVLVGTVIAGGGTASITAVAARTMEKTEPKKDLKDTQTNRTRPPRNPIAL